MMDILLKEDMLEKWSLTNARFFNGRKQNLSQLF